ncbi:ABC transporter permease/M1 family aminopeptidase [Solilutibacter tolerans]|uniref:Peptidase family M1 n=1 Tax=Solilutibacter tolerans TaxID=1604334 RepID=A0A1N6P032_9GAMM|nr:M1 family aminopeptidase [Lysobacter tolerans]SIP97653.1 Peptidase family M1 [Lysobacter tolerans]
MITEIFRFELREQFRSPLFWIVAVLFPLLGFALMSLEAASLIGGMGNIHRNAPTAIVAAMTTLTLFGLLMVTMLVSAALLRDFDQNTAELYFSTPIKPRQYLAGRLGAVLAASFAIYVLLAFAMYVAQFMPWIDASQLGPKSLGPYMWSLAVMVLPNLLFTGMLLALLAVVTRSILWVYIGVLGFITLWAVSQGLLSNVDNVWLVSLMEPLGIRAFGRTIRYWSAAERNTLLPPLTGYLLGNRALWLGVSVLLAGAVFALFRTERTGSGRGWRKRKRAHVPMVALPAKPLPRVQPSFRPSTGLSQLWKQLRFDVSSVMKGIPLIVMLLFGLANFIGSSTNMQSMYGTAIHPVSSAMASLLQNSYSFLLIIVVLFYAGELVFKERQAKMQDVTDAMPVPNWMPMLSKLLALLCVIVLFQSIGMLAGMLMQLAKGHIALEPLTWAKILLTGCVPFVLMGGLAFAAQVITNNKFAGYGVIVLVLIAQAAFGALGFEHNLYNFGSWPNAPWSDMNGFGHFLRGQFAFQGYWLVFMGALLLLAAAFWVRGVDGGLRQRLRVAGERLRGPLGIATVSAFALFAAIGGWLYWNTNVLNEYRSSDDVEDLQERYERDFRKYENLPQPKVLSSNVDVDLWPEKQSMQAEGRWRIVNPHATPISDIHVQMGDFRDLVSIDFGGQVLKLDDKALNYRIYRLDKPMQPGEEREMRFRVNYHPRGITNATAQTQLVENGSFFNSRLFPQFGYDPGDELQDKNERRKRGLGEPRRMAKLEDVSARQRNYLTDDADWIDFATTICTAPDQVALAPGYLKREFKREGRRCFSYEMDQPMLDFYAYLSARWQVKRGTYKDIPIEVYFDPRHGYNVDRMIEAVQKSLAYYEANFGPYQHRQVRIIEFPRYASFAQAFANTIPYSESVGFIADVRDRNEVDYVFYITAHEIAHQWWAHQVIGADVQGATVMSESLAQYSALMVMEKEYGRDNMRQFLKYELDRYLGARGAERLEEQPLYRVENQQYIHYEKGSLVFYRLRDELGEAKLNRAIKRFLDKHKFGAVPYPTTLDFLKEIRAEATPAQQQLITDLFEKISFYDNRVVEATAKKRPDGQYDVTLKLHADKRYADGQGKETAGQLDDWVDIGVFAKGKTDKERDQRVLYLKRHHITQANPELTVTVDALPIEAGFDPYNKLIDRVSSDNRKKVTLR